MKICPSTSNFFQNIFEMTFNDAFHTCSRKSVRKLLRIYWAKIIGETGPILQVRLHLRYQVETLNN